MATGNEHSRLISEAAKAALSPIGCKRRGSPRQWLSDEGFWAVVIEFQPSGWSKGSYLNVGAMWLWHTKPYFSFDEGYRIADFIPFEGKDQFAPLIRIMADHAAREVIRLREQFASIFDIDRHLASRLGADSWRVYHAAVAAGLVGDVIRARDLFNRFEAWANSPHWETKLQSDAKRLASLLDDPPQYKEAVQQIIRNARQLLGMPSDVALNDDIPTSP